MSRSQWELSAEIEANNNLGGSEPFVYFPQTTTYPTLPGERLVIRTKAPNGKHRHLIVQSAWATTQEEGAPLYGHTAMLAQLGIKPTLGHRASIDYQRARWWHVLFWGDKVALSVFVALLTVVSTALSAFVTYEDHPKGNNAIFTFVVLVVASVVAIINVFQQFLA